MVRLRELGGFNERERDRWVRDRAKEIPSGAVVLDIGAGTCPYREDFEHCHYIAHDFKRLEARSNRGGDPYGPISIEGDVLDISLPDGSVDVILCTEVLEHLPDPAAAVAKMSHLLRPGGRILLTAPLGSGLHQEPFHFFGGFTPAWYRLVLESSGFRNIQVQPNGGFFRHFGQESVRFSVILRGLGKDRAGRLAALVAWGLSLPLFRVAIPLACEWLDGLDGEKRFTVGYFVSAEKCP